jgi:hypothetical protein
LAITSQKNEGTEENVLQSDLPFRMKTAKNTLDIIPKRGIKINNKNTKINRIFPINFVLKSKI